ERTAENKPWTMRHNSAAHNRALLTGRAPVFTIRRFCSFQFDPENSARVRGIGGRFRMGTESRLYISGNVRVLLPGITGSDGSDVHFAVCVCSLYGAVLDIDANGIENVLMHMLLR